MTNPLDLDGIEAAWLSACAGDAQDIATWALDHVQNVLDAFAELRADKLRDDRAYQERGGAMPVEDREAWIERLVLEHRAALADLATAQAAADMTAESFAQRLTEADFRCGQTQEALEATRAQLAERDADLARNERSYHALLERSRREGEQIVELRGAIAEACDAFEALVEHSHEDVPSCCELSEVLTDLASRQVNKLLAALERQAQPAGQQQDQQDQQEIPWGTYVEGKIVHYFAPDFNNSTLCNGCHSTLGKPWHADTYRQPQPTGQQQDTAS